MKANDIFVIYGSDPADMTHALLDQIHIPSLIPPSARIVLKPNLVVAATSDGGATTHPEIVVTLIERLQKDGYRNIAIAESSWTGESTSRAFRMQGYDTITKTYGVPLVDVKHDEYVRKTGDGIPMEISKTILESDFLISLPVLKGHCQTTMTCALKNMKGCLSDRSKRQFHSLGLHHPIAALNTVRKADLVIVDSINGDLDFEEGGNPVHTNRMFAGLDSVLLDAFGANLMGFAVSDIPYINIAEQLGVGTTDLSQAHIVELNKDTAGTHPQPTGKIRALAKYTIPSSACSACYGNLIHALARLEERGLLGKLKQQVYIGQDYKGISQNALGVGTCTKGFTSFVPGCPPKAIDIVTFLEKQISLSHRHS